MNISSVDSFLNELNRFNAGKVKNIDDLRRLLDIAVEYDLEDKIEEAAFSAKYLQGLINIIQKKDSFSDAEYFEKMKRELTDGIEQFKQKLAAIVEKTPEFYQTIFEEKFMAITQASFANLKRLIEDFSLIKKYLNENRYGHAAHS